jgi:hypothetical protein
VANISGLPPPPYLRNLPLELRLDTTVLDVSDNNIVIANGKALIGNAERKLTHIDPSRNRISTLVLSIEQKK